MIQYFPDKQNGGPSNPELFMNLGIGFDALHTWYETQHPDTSVVAFKDAAKSAYTLAARLRNKENREESAAARESVEKK